jgi:hypothetical protein
VTVRLWSPLGRKTIRFRCSGGLDRAVDVTRRPTSVLLPMRGDSRRTCLFAITRGSLRAVGPYLVSVRAAITVRRAGR